MPTLSPRLKKGALIAAALIVVLVFSLVIARQVFHLTSTNAVIYFLRLADGSLEITNHLRPDENDRVERMLDISCLFNVFAKAQATIGLGNIELTWSERNGDGVIKEFRLDGTELLIVLSRFANDEGTPQGLFIGGDLPLGDTQRSSEAANNNTGIAYYDGKRWNHIWCSLNEGVSLVDGDKTVYGPEKWNYLGSTVLKSTSSEVVLESRHEVRALVRGAPVVLSMKRTVLKRLGDDYLILKVEFSNQGRTPFAYSYELGDEPWVGDFFRGSRGNIGWTDGELFKYEDYVDTSRHKFAGYWDIGNDVIHEKHNFTGYADFVEWLSGPPSFVYFANNFGYDRVDERKPLSSWNNRVLGLVWLNQALRPGERKEYVVALGMAKPVSQGGPFFPLKPSMQLSVE